MTVFLLTVAPRVPSCLELVLAGLVSFVLVGPVLGIAAGPLPKSWLLAGSSALCLFASFGAKLSLAADSILFGLAALGAAEYFSSSAALAISLSQQIRMPLGRANAWLACGLFLAIAGGLLLVWQPVGAQVDASVALIRRDADLAAFASLILYGLSGMLALALRFGEDKSGECRAVVASTDAVPWWRDKESLGFGLGSGCTIGCLVAALVLHSTVSAPGFGATTIFYLLSGAAVGAIVTGIERHPTRILGFVPLATTGLAISLFVLAGSTAKPIWIWLGVGFLAGMIHVPLYAAFEECLPEDSRVSGMASLHALAALVAMAVVFAGGAIQEPLHRAWLFSGSATIAAVVSWRFLLRDTVEILTEILVWPFYRIHCHGEGVDRIPRRGPIVVIANHSAWFDPIWLAKVLPRRLVPMLTSVFYDIPVLRTLVRIAHTIRVQYAQFRRDAPELKEAIATLDRGEALLIFPEGQMRKQEDQPLKQFGRGIWHILKERPQTPVVVCWIEGGWGSFTSYFGGKPTRNKRMDFWRRIDVGVNSPEVLPAEILADHRSTRVYLMKACLSARRHIGLEPYPYTGWMQPGAAEDYSEGESEQQ